MSTRAQMRKDKKDFQQFETLKHDELRPSSKLSNDYQKKIQKKTQRTSIKQSES